MYFIVSIVPVGSAIYIYICAYIFLLCTTFNNSKLKFLEFGDLVCLHNSKLFCSFIYFIMDDDISIYRFRFIIQVVNGQRRFTV